MGANACDERPISENELCATTKRWTEAGDADAESASATDKLHRSLIGEVDFDTIDLDIFALDQCTVRSVGTLMHAGTDRETSTAGREQERRRQQRPHRAVSHCGLLNLFLHGCHAVDVLHERASQCVERHRSAPGVLHTRQQRAVALHAGAHRRSGGRRRHRGGRGSSGGSASGSDWCACSGCERRSSARCGRHLECHGGSGCGCCSSGRIRCASGVAEAAGG